MKWRSSNVWYLAGIGIPLAIIAVLGIKAVWPSIWGSAAILVITVLLLRALIGKTRFIPHPLAQYGELKPQELDLPGNPGVDLYTSGSMCRYDFVLRIVEFLSPLSFEGGRPKVVINPRLLEEKGERFMQIAVMREVERYRRNYQAVSILRLVLPLFAFAIAVLTVFAFDIPLTERLGVFWVQFAMPFLYTILLGLHLFFWNRRISAMDGELDLFLTSVFTVEDVKRYIISVGELERGYEKSKTSTLNQHYINTRLKQLENHKT